AALQHERPQAPLAEFLGSPTTGDAGAHDDGVVRLAHTAHARPISARGTHPSKRPGTGAWRSSRVAPISEVYYPTSVSSFIVRKNDASSGPGVLANASRSRGTSSARGPALAHCRKARPQLRRPR